MLSASRRCVCRENLCAEINNWICICVEPFIKKEFKAEPRWELFRKDNSVWNHVDWSKGVQFNDDFELIDLPIRHSRIAKIIVEKYPDCPMEIFPEQL
jgi:hypothetical protein